MVVVAGPGLGPLDAGGGIVCGVDVVMVLSLGVEADNGRLLVNCWLCGCCGVFCCGCCCCILLNGDGVCGIDVAGVL